MIDERTTPLILYLRRLAAHEDRATLAALRMSLRDGHELDGLRVVLPFLGPHVGRRAEDDAVLIAALFALHPETSSLSLPDALRKLWRPEGGHSESGSVEKRFQALLAADRSDLPIHLRHAISLVAPSGLGIHWEDLYRALRYWDHEDDFVRRRWARSFWGVPADDAGESDQESPTA